METLRVGINSAHPETRFAQMLAFGRDGMISRDEVRTVVDYVQSLSGADGAARDGSPRRARSSSPRTAPRATARTAAAASSSARPNLTDASWIYGGDDASLFETIHDGRQGWMPAWEDRLSLVDRKILTVYLQELAEEGSQ